MVAMNVYVNASVGEVDLDAVRTIIGRLPFGHLEWVQQKGKGRV